MVIFHFFSFDQVFHQKKWRGKKGGRKKEGGKQRKQEKKIDEKKWRKALRDLSAKYSP